MVNLKATLRELFWNFSISNKIKNSQTLQQKSGAEGEMFEQLQYIKKIVSVWETTILYTILYTSWRSFTHVFLTLSDKQTFRITYMF